MSVVTAMEETGPCRLKLTIEVPAPAVDAEVGRVVQEYRKHASIPGFRKGKVPATVIRRRFAEEIERETVDRLLPRYWRQAEAEKDLDPLLPPTVEDVTFEHGQPMQVVAMVETRPTIALGEYREFELPEESVDATDAEVDDAVADLRRNFAEWNTVDRAAAQGDLVVGTVTAVLPPAAEGEDETPTPEPRPLHFELGAPGSDEELALLLTGKTAGQSVRHEVKAAEEGEDATAFDIEIQEVKEQELPEIDDEMLEKIGGFESVDALRETIAKSLSERKAGDLRRRRERAMLDALRERHDVTLPEGVVQREIEGMVQEYAERLVKQGVDLETAQFDWSRMADDVKPQAEQRVQERLLLDAVAKQDELRLDEAKFETMLAAAASQQGMSSHALRQRLSEDGRMESLRGQMLREQTVAYLLGESDEADDSTGADGDGDETDSDSDD